MKISNKIEEAFDKAKRTKDKVSLNVIRAIKSEISKLEKSKERASKNPVVDCLKKQLKQREASVIQFEKANRKDLVDVELAEIEIIKLFLPKQLDAEEVDDMIKICIFETNATSIKDMGKVMKLAREKSQGKADNSILSEKIKQKLS